MERVISRCVDQGRMLASGTAWEAASSKPLAQMALKPACAASLAERELWADMAITGLLMFNMERNADILERAAILRRRLAGRREVDLKVKPRRCRVVAKLGVNRWEANAIEAKVLKREDRLWGHKRELVKQLGNMGTCL